MSREEDFHHGMKNVVHGKKEVFPCADLDLPSQFQVRGQHFEWIVNQIKLPNFRREKQKQYEDVSS